MSGAWRELRRILGRDVPNGDPAISTDAEKARREADLKETQRRARVAAAIARIVARERT